MKVSMMTLGDYQTNCYLVTEDEKTCVVIDPGYPDNLLFDTLENKGYDVAAVLLTHGHFDHVGAARQIAADYDCDVYLCQEDVAMPETFTAGSLRYTKSMKEGDTLIFAGLSFTVMQTPGHTPGSCCLRCGDWLFSGDTLFNGSCGRTDLPGGSWDTIMLSLKRLAALPDNLTVCPGHGMRTTLSFEKKYNPYLQ